jgi:hypothetical protein
MRRLLTYVFSMRQFFNGGLVLLARGVFTRRHKVLLLNRLQYSLGLIAASLVLPRVDIRKVQDLLGHRHITTTQIYDKRRRSASESASHDVPI